MSAAEVAPSRLRIRDLAGEGVAGLRARPARTALTALGTVLGVAAFVAVLGLTATAGGQIGKRFTALAATEVVVEDADEADRDHLDPAFTADADARVGAIRGVRAAGVWWPVGGDTAPEVGGVVLPGRSAPAQIPVIAASPGLFDAIRPGWSQGRAFDALHDRRGERVAVLGAAAARQLGVTELALRPAVFIDGVPFTVIGVLDGSARLPELMFAVLVPRHSAEEFWGRPGAGRRAKMLVETELGAAQVVAAQAALALRPDAPQRFTVVTPPDPRQLRDQVSADVGMLFLLLAGVCLLIGAVGIANTTMVAVLERVPEIGLRRALGARPWHIAAQFLAESAAIGSLAGWVGAAVGAMTVVAVALARGWTAILEPAAVLPAPLAGLVVGVVAGAYPAIRAARIEPVAALRR
ncbi:ABC transporter permease [Catellatospora coxensis]|uniref:ABC transporter permease n=1 Tax=Catellatospora coxensis TaxID=310354 RepID=A0A8J3P9G7_9ACTN|nr:ABC transporter permease [Catellatospora coxensis]GIG08792.1 ABC transporter permease [Catellatospora coxensis]